jgi:hypothetical protein
MPEGIETIVSMRQFCALKDLFSNSLAVVAFVIRDDEFWRSAAAASVTEGDNPSDAHWRKTSDKIYRCPKLERL